MCHPNVGIHKALFLLQTWLLVFWGDFSQTLTAFIQVPQSLTGRFLCELWKDNSRHRERSNMEHAWLIQTSFILIL